MVTALLVIGLLAMSVAVVLPLFLPWPQQLRWLTAHAALSGDVSAEEVVVVDVRTRRDHTLVVLDRGHGRARLALDAPVRAGSDRVLWWAIEQTPLLLLWEPDDHLSLHSGSAAVHGLRVRPDERAPTAADA